MRIALHSVGDTGRRAGRILLSEKGLAALGLYGQSGGVTEDRKTTAITSLDGYNPLVTDDEGDAGSFARIAAEEGVSCVLSVRPDIDTDLFEAFATNGRTLLVGADLAGIAETLATHELAARGAASRITISWTVPGPTLGSGEAIPFPDPVGARWGRRQRVPRNQPARDPVETMRVECPVTGPWAGAMARVTGNGDRVVGIADDAAHLAGIALAAGALAVAEGSFPPGVWMPADGSEAFLAAAIRVGMDVAAYMSDG